MSDGDSDDDGESKRHRSSREIKKTHFALVSSITSPSSQARSTGTVRLLLLEEERGAEERAAAAGGGAKRTEGKVEETTVTTKATDAAAFLSSESPRCQR